MKIMDVADVETKCIPETMLLCVEKIFTIIRNSARVWLSELELIDVFPFSFIHKSVFSFCTYSIKLAHEMRYVLRTSIVEPFAESKQLVLPKIGAVVSSLRGG